MENHTRAADAKATNAELSISPFALEVWLEKKHLIMEIGPWKNIMNMPL